MSTTQDLFEKAKKHFDHPTIFIQERDDVSWYIQQIGNDAQCAIAGRTGLACPMLLSLATLLVRRTWNADQPRGMIGFDAWVCLVKPISTI